MNNIASPDFDRNKEELWFPIFEGIGFQDIKLSSDGYDKHFGIDAEANIVDPVNRDIHHHKFALRTRNILTHNKFISDITIRFKRDSGAKTEFEKIFNPEDPNIFPTLFCYGFGDPITNKIVHHIIFDTMMLQEIESDDGFEIHKQNIKQNTDYKKSSFIPIPLKDIVSHPMFSIHGVLSYSRKYELLMYEHLSDSDKEYLDEMSR